MFFDAAEIRAEISALQERFNALFVLVEEDDNLSAAAECERIEDSIRALNGRIADIESEYADSDSLYWETAEVRGWV